MDDMPTKGGHSGDAERSPPRRTVAALLEGESVAVLPVLQDVLSPIPLE
ncbi:hypothetical protein ACFTWS_29955 [Streptomyces sp. NPDC057027]